MVRTAAGAKPKDAPGTPDPGGTTATSAVFVRQFGIWQERANAAPVFVTHHGRVRHVLLSLAAFDALQAPGERPALGGGDAAVKLETLLHLTDQIVVAVDDKLVVTGFNQAAAAFFKTVASQVMGAAAHVALPDIGRTVLAAHLNRAVTRGDVASLDLPSITRPAEWLRCHVFPYGGGAACLIRVVTGERVATAAAGEAAALHEALAATGLIGRGSLSLRGTFTQVDRRFAALAGFEPAELLQVRLTDILPLPRRIAAAQCVEAVLSGGGARRLRSALLVKQGGELAVDIGIAPRAGAHGLDGACVVIVERGG